MNTHRVVINATKQNYEDIRAFKDADPNLVPTGEGVVAVLTVEGSPEFVANIVRAFGDALES